MRLSAARAEQKGKEAILRDVLYKAPFHKDETLAPELRIENMLMYLEECNDERTKLMGILEAAHGKIKQDVDSAGETAADIVEVECDGIQEEL